MGRDFREGSFKVIDLLVCIRGLGRVLGRGMMVRGNPQENCHWRKEGGKWDEEKEREFLILSFFILVFDPLRRLITKNKHYKK